MPLHTPDPLVRRFSSLVERHLSDEIVALYLRGSAARDDWLPGHSDIDFYVLARDEILGNASTRDVTIRKLNVITNEISSRWPGGNPSLRIVPLSSLVSNPVGSYITGIDARLLLGSSVLDEVTRPSALSLSRFGQSEFDRFSRHWIQRADLASDGVSHFSSQEEAVLKLAQMALLSKGVLKVHKLDVAESFKREFPNYVLSKMVDQAQRLRQASPWPFMPGAGVSGLRAGLFTRMLRQHIPEVD